jgi:Protein of unknown function (DUF2004)
LATFELPGVGPLDFPSDTGGWWGFKLAVSAHEINVHVFAAQPEMTEQMFEGIRGFLINAARFDSIARAAIELNFAENADGSSRTYLSHHISEFNEENRQKYFGRQAAEVSSAKQLLAALSLKSIALQPNSGSGVAIFDYTIDVEATNYVLAVEIKEDGTVNGVSMES